MRLVRVLTIVLSCFTLAGSQGTVDWKWRSIRSNDARLQAIAPCDLVRSIKSFQDKPRPIKVYGFKCEIDGFSFLISVGNHMDGFNPYTIENAFDSHEFMLKNMFGDVERINIWADITPEGFRFCDYDTRLKDGGRVRSLVVVNEFATYEAMVGATPDDLKTGMEKKLDFDSFADRYLKSVQVKK